MDIEELFEVPQAVLGDFDWDESELRKSGTAFSKYWKIIGKFNVPGIGSLDLVEGQNSWMVGSMQPRDSDPAHEDFRALIRIDGEPLHRTVPYKNPLVVRLVYVLRNERLGGLATDLYRRLVDMGYTIVGDAEQYNGARRLWARLSKTPGYAVDLLNVSSGKVLKTGATLHQGANEMDFDRTVWSEDPSLAHIRPVFRKTA